MSRTRSNKAKKDKGSILADVKNLLCVLHPAMQRMPKIERIEGAPMEMKRACYDLIRHFTVAMECQEVRLHYIRKMISGFGVVLASFELCIQFGLFVDSDKLRIAIQLEQLRNMIHPDWWQWLSYDSRRQCLVYLPKYSIKSRLSNKYHLKLRHYDTIRNHRAHKRAGQREADITIAA